MRGFPVYNAYTSGIVQSLCCMTRKESRVLETSDNVTDPIRLQSIFLPLCRLAIARQTITLSGICLSFVNKESKTDPKIPPAIKIFHQLIKENSFIGFILMQLVWIDSSRYIKLVFDQINASPRLNVGKLPLSDNLIFQIKAWFFLVFDSLFSSLPVIGSQSKNISSILEENVFIGSITPASRFFLELTHMSREHLISPIFYTEDYTSCGSLLGLVQIA